MADQNIPLDKARRVLDPERTRENILDVAHEEFVENGLSGARVDAIAARTSTTKRMLYYYFGSKDGLYLAVLERAYARIREIESKLDLGRLPPQEAMIRLTEITFDYHADNPDFVRLVSTENIHHGRHIRASEGIPKLNVTVIDTLTDILHRGQKDGTFRAGLSPVDVHMLMSAFCFYRVSNRYTFGQIFKRDLDTPTVRAHHRALIVDAILRLVLSDPAKSEKPSPRRKKI